MTEGPLQLRRFCAVRFDRPMTSGRTKPCVLTCVADDGHEEQIVVKLKGSGELTPISLVCEVMAAFLASDVGLHAAVPAVVQVEPGFELCVPAEHALHRALMGKSHGLNFGTLYLGPGTATLPVDRPLSPDMELQAAQVLAFDAVIQNPDRRRGNPNLLHRHDRFLLLDHELAFSFLRDILPKEPWEPGALDFIGQHPLTTPLKNRNIQWPQILAPYGQVPAERFDQYLAAIPDDWKQNNRAAGQIVEYLMEVTRNLPGVALNIARALA